jgi:hypothetical protein
VQRKSTWHSAKYDVTECAVSKSEKRGQPPFLEKRGQPPFRGNGTTATVEKWRETRLCPDGDAGQGPRKGDNRHFRENGGCPLFGGPIIGAADDAPTAPSTP